jgi:hypothetical protein
MYVKAQIARVSPVSDSCSCGTGMGSGTVILA